jgi:hypothetical protein
MKTPVAMAINESKFVRFQTKRADLDNPKNIRAYSVVDQEKGTKYPENFVCVLPEFFGLPTRKFEKLSWKKPESRTETKNKSKSCLFTEGEDRLTARARKYAEHPEYLSHLSRRYPC